MGGYSALPACAGCVALPLFPRSEEGRSIATPLFASHYMYYRLARSSAPCFGFYSRSSITRFDFLVERGSRPFSTTFTSGVKPMWLFTSAAICPASARKS